VANRGLGWFSVGLGIARLIAPGALAKAVGVGDHSRNRLLMRVLGIRDLACGVGLLSGGAAAPWLRGRVAGDAMDLALLGVALARPTAKSRALRGAGLRSIPRLPLAMGAVGALAAVDVLVGRRMMGTVAVVDGRPGARGAIRGALDLASSITVIRPPETVYAFWRNFQNLPRFMNDVVAVQTISRLESKWSVSAPGGQIVQWEGLVTEDHPNERIVWRTMRGSDIAHAGEVSFTRAPGARGTEVRLKLRVESPVGFFGLSKLARGVAEQQMGQSLLRFKQLLEIGEVMRSDASIHRGLHPARPDGKTIT